MPLVKNVHKKFTHNENPKSAIFKRINRAALHLIRHPNRTLGESHI